MSWPWETRTSTCRNFATISSGLYRFLAIAVLLDVETYLKSDHFVGGGSGSHMGGGGRGFSMSGHGFGIGAGRSLVAGRAFHGGRNVHVGRLHHRGFRSFAFGGPIYGYGYSCWEWYPTVYGYVRTWVCWLVVGQ